MKRLVLLLLLSGCVTAGPLMLGRDFDARPLKTFRPGVTTRAQASEALGAPQSRMMDAQGREVWFYRYGVTQFRQEGIGHRVDVRAKTASLVFQGDLLDSAHVAIPEGMSEEVTEPPAP